MEALVAGIPEAYKAFVVAFVVALVVALGGFACSSLGCILEQRMFAGMVQGSEEVGHIAGLMVPHCHLEALQNDRKCF